MLRCIIITSALIFFLFSVVLYADSMPLSSFEAGSNYVNGVVINQGDDVLYSTSFNGGQHAYTPFKDFIGTAETYMQQEAYTLDLGSNKIPKFVYVLAHITDNPDPTNKGCVFIFYPNSNYTNYYVLSAPVGKNVKCSDQVPDQAGIDKSNVLIVNVTS